MSRNQGGIPRWLTGVNLAAILVALAIVVPIQGRASHTAAPTSLCLCFRMSATAPKFTWSDPAASSLTEGYILQRSRTSDFTSNVVEIRIARNTFDFIDETTMFSTTFHYRVASYTGTDRSGWSNIVTATNGSGTYPTQPATPTNLSVAPESSGGLRVSWSNPATNETGVWVQRSSDNGTTWQYRASLSLNSTSFVDTDPPPGGPMYRVATFNSKGASYSYSVQYVNQGVPGAPSVGPVAPSVPNFGSVVPSSIATPTLGGIPSITPSVPSLSPTPTVSIPSITTPSPTVSIPSVNPSTIIPTVPLPDPNKYQLWVGLRFGGPTGPLSGAWILPSNCGLTQTCPPPTGNPNIICFPVVPGGVEACYLINLSGT